MKKAILLLAAMAALPFARAQEGGDGNELFLNREAPRSLTVSYDSEETAMQAGGESPYIRRVSGEWEQVSSRAGEHTIFSNRFSVPFEWDGRQVFLHVGGASNDYQVWLNERLVGTNASAATAAEFDITEYVAEGRNALEIRVLRGDANKISAADGRTDAPALTGEVYAFSQPTVRIRDYEYSCSFEGAEANLQLGVIMKSHLLNRRTVKLHYKLISPQGGEVASGNRDVELSMRGEDTVRFFVNVRNAQAWSPHSPAIYTLLLTTRFEGRYPEYVAYPVGLRTVEMSDGRLLVNGSPAVFSTAKYSGRKGPQEAESALRRLREEGYNSVALSGGPQPDYFYALCDRLGLYVCDQADVNTSRFGDDRSRGGNPSNDPARREEFVDRTLAMWRISRNHPSVVMFSIGEDSSNGTNLYESYLALKNAEQARPVIYPDAAGEWNSDAVGGSLDAGAADGRLVFDPEKAQLPAPTNVEVSQNPRDGRRVSLTNHASHAVRGTLLYAVTQGAESVVEGAISLVIPAGGSVETDLPQPPATKKKKLKYTVRFTPDF